MKKLSIPACIALPIAMLHSPSAAQELFDCEMLGEGVYKVYSDIGLPKNDVPPNKTKKIKKGAIVLNETRLLGFETFKPEGGIGGVIPYERAQMVFSKYLVDGQEKLCTSQRNEDVFGAGEQVQKYRLRCLSDKDEDGRFNMFRRYSELVSYSFKTGETGVARAVPQEDHPLVQPFGLVSHYASKFRPIRQNKALRSILHITKATKKAFTLKASSDVSFPGFDRKGRNLKKSAPSVEVQVPLVDGSHAFIGRTKVSISRVSSRWKISALSGFADEVKLICGGTALETEQSVTIFSGGGMLTLSRKANKERHLE